MRASIFLSGAALAAFTGCGADDVKCGDGTTRVGDTCQGGTNTTCGAGTHLEGNACVPDGPGAGGAPTIAKIDPNEAGLAGGGLFTITGTNLAGSDIADLHVFFGDPTNPNCEAVIGAATSTAIAGQVPSACDFNVVVTVTTNKGSATTPFHYDAILAVDGDAGGVNGQTGSLYIIDPFTHLYGDMGGVYDQDGYQYGISGLAFAGNTLYAVSTGDSGGDFGDGNSSLLSIDLLNGATWIGETMDSAGNPFVITDIKSNGTTLYGLAYAGNPATSRPLNAQQFVVSIDTATGEITKIGNATVSPNMNGGALAIDGANKVYTATTGWSSFDSIDMTTGAHTSMFDLDYLYNSPITSMAYFGTYLLAVVDNGTRGVELGNTNDWSGETLVIIDPAADPNSEYYVSSWFEMPNRESYKAMVDAIAVPPTTFSLSGTAQAKLARTKWAPLREVTTPN